MKRIHLSSGERVGPSWDCVVVYFYLVNTATNLQLPHVLRTLTQLSLNGDPNLFQLTLILRIL